MALETRQSEVEGPWFEVVHGRGGVEARPCTVSFGIIGAIAAGILLTALTGCRGATPTAEPTVAPIQVQELPSETATPLPSETPVPSETPLDTPMPTSAPTAFMAGGAADKPAPGCQIPSQPETWSLAPAADAPADARTAWGQTVTPSLRAEVVEQNADTRTYTLRAVEPETAYRFTLTYSGPPLPLQTGQTYRFTTQVDRAGEAPAGAALKVTDDGGLVFLGVSARESDGAAARLLGGDRGGLAVSQLATRCLYAPVNACGYQLRAAPVEIRRGTDAVTVNAGESGKLPGDPAYKVTVLTSHYRLWMGDLACPNPADWVLSVRVERGG